MKTLKLKQFPLEGEIACEQENLKMGIYFFSRFTDNDEQIAKSNDKSYYVIVEDNPVPSLDNLLKDEILTIVEALRFKGDLFHKNIDKNKALKYYNLIDKIQNGVETDKEQPRKWKDSQVIVTQLNKQFLNLIGYEKPIFTEVKEEAYVFDNKSIAKAFIKRHFSKDIKFQYINIG